MADRRPPALADPILCLVTDRSVAPGGDLPRAVEAAVSGGVTMVQLREKDLPAGELLELAVELRRVTLGRALLLVNDRVDVALAAGSDGVQLGEQSLPVAVARRLCEGTGMLVGRSAHTVDGARQAERDGVDLLVLGTIYPSRSHPGAAGGGPALVKAVTAQVTIPTVAIGGITAANAGAVMAAGAAGVAVVSAILSAADPEQAARDLWEAIGEP